MQLKTFFQSSLVFNSYLIGYKGRGESILVTLEADDEIVFSGVIDSYELKNNNETINLLEKLKIKELDFLCWSHHHDDHTKGFLNIMNAHVTKKTRLIYPQNVNMLKEHSEITQKIADEISKIAAYDLRKKDKPKIHPIGNYRPLLSQILEYTPGKTSTYKNESNAYKFMVEAFTPVSEVIENRKITEKSHNSNDYSVSLLIKIGKASFFYASDIQDVTIQLMETEYLPEKIDYVKIPHHASKHSLKLLKLQQFSRLQEKKSNVACTSEYINSRLPDQEVINEYNLYFPEIYVTGQEGNYGHDFGIIHTEYNVLTGKFTTNLERNAYKIHSNITIH